MRKYYGKGGSLYLAGHHRGSGSLALSGSGSKLDKDIRQIVQFIHSHPAKAALIFHHHHHRKKGSGMQGSGIFGDAWSAIKHVGKKVGKEVVKDAKKVAKVGKKVVHKVYQGAEKLYDYTNGLAPKLLELTAKRIFNVDLNKYATYRDAIKAYKFATGDPRKYKELYHALTHPEETFKHIKKYAKSGLSGFVTGGPTGAAIAVAKQRIKEDIMQDLDTLGMPKKYRKYASKAVDVASKVVTPGRIESFGKGYNKYTNDIDEMNYSGSGKINPRELLGRIPKLAKHYLENNRKDALDIIRHIRGGGYQQGGSIKSLLAKLGKISKKGVHSFVKWVKENPEAAKKIAQAGLKIGKYAEQSYSKSKSGSGSLSLSGQGSLELSGSGKLKLPKIPKKAIEFMERYPKIAKKMLRKMRGGQYGSGLKSFLKSLGISTLGAAALAGASALYNWKKKNPDKDADWTMSMTGAEDYNYPEEEDYGDVHGIISTPGRGLSLSGGRHLPYGVSMGGNGRIKRDRYSVWHGYYPRTKSGLMKRDLMLKGKKVISRRKHMLGKGMVQQGIGLYK